MFVETLTCRVVLESRMASSIVPASRKGTAKLKELVDIERAMQEKWEREKVFEEDAPEPGSQDK